MLARSFSQQKLKHSCALSHFISCQIRNPSHSHLPSPCDPPSIPFQNPTPPHAFFFFRSSPNAFRPFCTYPTPKPSSLLTRDGNFDEKSNLPVCQGCGVYMQDSDSKRPGFFIKPCVKGPDYKLKVNRSLLVEVPSIPDTHTRDLVAVPEFSDSETSQSRRSAAFEIPQKPVVCARCHSLRYYGKVKDPTVENLLPRFNFDLTVGRRLATADGPRAVVLMVVDALDFDGSFPQTVARLVSGTIDRTYGAWTKGKPANAPRVVLVVTKIDLLPSSLSPTGFEYWVRRRASEGGANTVASVHLVSPVRGWGLLNLVDTICGLAGQRGQVWAVGAQNAGKSTLLNSIAKVLEKKALNLTEARVPGTTLGIVRIEDVLPGQSKLFDTPGLVHSHQITSRLTPEEQKLVNISKEVKPRTYRIKAGHSIHVAGLLRLDLEDLSVETIYVTVWASPFLALHMGKTRNAERLLEKHFGRQLQPPIGAKRAEELGKWQRKGFLVRGNRWDANTVDIAVAGLGWLAIGLKGEAVLGVWTHEGVDVVLRDALIPHKAKRFDVAGFTFTKTVSLADQVESRELVNRQKKGEGEAKESKKLASKRGKMLELDGPKVDTGMYLPPVDMSVARKEKKKREKRPKGPKVVGIVPFCEELMARE